MSDIVSPLLQWLNANPEMAGFCTFIISALESVAIIGTIVPGTIMMTAIGALAGAGVIPLWETLIWATVGAIVGDGISYWIGHYFKDRLHRVWPFRSHPTLLKTGEIFFHKYGSMSVFIGRFVGPVRALVPLVAGMLGMKPLRFTLANVTSAIGWAPAYMLPGILLGAASTELPPDIAIHVILVLLMIFLFILLCLWFIYKLLQLIHKQLSQLQDGMWTRLQKNPVLSPLTKVLKHYDRAKTHGQLNLAIYFVIISVLILGLALYIKAVGPSNIMVNDAMFHLSRGIRTNTADNVMIYITLLGQKQVILPVVLLIFSWLLLCKRWRVAFHALALGVLAGGSVFVLKNLIQSPRPLGIVNSPETYSMPSGHTTLATTVFIGLAFLIANTIKPAYRWCVYTIGIMVAVMVGVSRIYLSAHWFTDVVASWLLSAAVLIIVIISYQRYKEQPIKPLTTLLVFLVSLGITVAYFSHKHFAELKANYALLNWPTVAINMTSWWQKNDLLPTYRTSLFGFPSQQINIEWTGDLDKIKATLLKEGWTKPPARDWVSTLHRIADVSSTEFLPLVSPQYLDQKPALIMTRDMQGRKGLLVLRLWNSSRMIKETHAPVWVGCIGLIPRSYSWIYKTRPGEITIEPEFIFPVKIGSAGWQWKTMDQTISRSSKIPTIQKIMLVRPNKSVHQKK